MYENEGRGGVKIRNWANLYRMLTYMFFNLLYFFEKITLELNLGSQKKFDTPFKILILLSLNLTWGSKLSWNKFSASKNSTVAKFQTFGSLKFPHLNISLSIGYKHGLALGTVNPSQSKTSKYQSLYMRSIL